MDNQWDALRVFLEDGAVELTNNRCELQLRTVAIGRRSYLFAGSDAGAERAAIIDTIIRTAARHGVDPYAYLTALLREPLARHAPAELDALLPRAPANPKTSAAA